MLLLCWFEGTLMDSVPSATFVMQLIGPGCAFVFARFLFATPLATPALPHSLREALDTPSLASGNSLDCSVRYMMLNGHVVCKFC